MSVRSGSLEQMAVHQKDSPRGGSRSQVLPNTHIDHGLPYTQQRFTAAAGSYLSYFCSYSINIYLLLSTWCMPTPSTVASGTY